MSAQFVLNALIEEIQEVPFIFDTPATGSFNVVLDGNVLAIAGIFDDLTSPLTSVGTVDSEGNSASSITLHLGAFGTNGNIIRNLTVIDNGDNSGRFDGRFELTAEEIAAIEAGDFYLNLHTANNPNGELRGQIRLSQDDFGAIFDIPLAETQEVPTLADSPASGSLNATLEDDRLSIIGIFGDLSSSLAAIEGAGTVNLYLGSPGENGTIVGSLTVNDNGDNSGSFSGSFELTAEQLAAARSGDLYVNVHTANNPTGELRGQVFLEDTVGALNLSGTLIDLSDLNQDVGVNFTISREADFNNTVGFYTVNADGSVVDPASGNNINPGETGYLQAVIANRLDIAMTTADDTSTEFTSELAGGAIYAPFIVVNGGIAELTDSDMTNDPTVYVPFPAANGASFNHILNLGDNTLGFEDLPSGGDLDYNDFRITVDFTELN
jgi:hypothetical protein